MMWMIRVIPMAIIAVWAFIKLIAGKERANTRVWLLIAASMLAWFSSTFLGLRIGFTIYFAGFVLTDIVFILPAIAALCNKRILGILGAIGVWLIGILEMLAYPDLLNYPYVGWLTIVTTLVFWQYKHQKTWPFWVWIALAVTGLLNISAAILMLALLVWLSGGVTKVQDMEHKESEQSQSSVAELADKLKALEDLQVLLNDGLITQDEFDVKKRQLLG